MTDEMAPSLNDLKQQLRALDLRIKVFGNDDPVQRAELVARRDEVQQRILERGGEAPRLPYGDPD